MRRDEYPLKAEVRLFVNHELSELLEKSFRPLEAETRFSRGFIDARREEGGFVVFIYAKDVTSLRSLISNVIKSIYLILSAFAIE